MNAVKEWAFTICAAGVMAALIQIISPQGAMKRSVQIILNLFVMICVLSPLSSLTLDRVMPGFYDEGYPADSVVDPQAADNLYKSAVQREVSKLVLDKLTAMGINGADVRINITVNEGNVEIGEVSITLPEESRDRGDEIERRLEGELELAIVIVNSQEVKK